MGGEYWFCVWFSAYFVVGFSIAYMASAYGPKSWADALLSDDFPLGVMVCLFWPLVGLCLVAAAVCGAFQRDVMRRRKIRDAQKDPAPAEEAP